MDETTELLHYCVSADYIYPQGSAGILDKYAATATTVTDGERIIGLLYGGCATAAVNNNAIFGRWLQARHSPTEMG